MKKIVIFGSGEIADLAKFYFSNDGNREVVSFVVDDEYVTDTTFSGLPLIALSELVELFPPDSYDAHVALSYSNLNKFRQLKYECLKGMGYNLASYVSSRSVFWPDLTWGDNCFILENQTIQPQVSIGNNVVIWSGNHIGHGARILNHVYVSSHVVICGHCQIGERSFIGVNASLKDFVDVGSDCFISMGSLVTKNMPNESVAVASSAEIYFSEDRRSRLLKKKYFKDF